MLKQAGRVGVICFFVISLFGCSFLKPDKREELPVPLEITLGASERVNPSVSGRPSPIAVRLFELTKDTKFSAAGYFELMAEDGKAALGEEMLTSEEFVLLPGEVRVIRKRAASDSRFLGIVAGYRDLSGSTWRAVEPLPAPHLEGRLWSSKASPTKHLYVVIGERSVTVREPTK
ncbi:MAG: type VI secretion system lipoprotein TssJ [Betaproteobacteria bacterium]|nr:type VI secretion system lipoprotein TssJ [Betaproteobacteria bacterium]